MTYNSNEDYWYPIRRYSLSAYYVLQNVDCQKLDWFYGNPTHPGPELPVTLLKSFEEFCHNNGIGLIIE
jgi:hypothetical protein